MWLLVLDWRVGSVRRRADSDSLDHPTPIPPRLTATRTQSARASNRIDCAHLGPLTLRVSACDPPVVRRPFIRISVAMLPQLLTVRSLIDRAIATARESLHSTPGLHETLQSLRTQLGAVLERLVLAMQLTSLRGAYTTVARVFIKLARLCIEALDWLLLPRLAWKITARHCVALLVLYFVKVFFNVSCTSIMSHRRTSQTERQASAHRAQHCVRPLLLNVCCSLRCLMHTSRLRWCRSCAGW